LKTQAAGIWLNECFYQGQEMNMALQSVLVSSDQNVLSVLPEALRSVGLAVDVYRRAEKFSPVATNNLSCVILDCEQPEVEGVLNELRQTERFKHVMTIALSDGRRTLARGSQGTTLTFHKPLTREKVAGNIRTVRNLIVHEKRRASRHPLQVELTLTHENRKLRASTLNLSEGGLGFSSSAQVRWNAVLEFAFNFPGQKIPVRGFGKVAWFDEETMRGGLRFTSLENKDALTSWLFDRCEEERASWLQNPTVCFKD
jgi:FixJ family two-component response regulator